MKTHVMNIERTKLHLMRLILQTNDEKLLLKVKDILGQEEADWWDEMSEEEKEEIKVGLDQADRGEFADIESVMKRFDKWR